MSRRVLAATVMLALAAVAVAVAIRRDGPGPGSEAGPEGGDPPSPDARPPAVPLAAAGRASSTALATGSADATASPTAAVLTVSVVDTVGAPIAGASVLWISESPASGTTDRRGQVRWPIDARDDGFLVASAPGFLPSYEEVSALRTASIARELRLRAGHRATGRVHRSSGAPVVGVSVAPRLPPLLEAAHLDRSDSIVTETLPSGEVVVRQAQGRTPAGLNRLYDELAARAATTTDAAGGFEILFAEAGRGTLYVTEYVPGNVDERTERSIAASTTVRYEGRPLDIVLDPEVPATGGVSFRLVAPSDGSGHVYAGVRLVDPVASSEVATLSRHRRADPWVDAQADARFDVRQVPDGDFVVEVSVDPWVPRALPVRVRGGAIVDLGEVVLELGARLRGRVVAVPATDLGTPRIVATPVGAPGFLGERIARADASGAFELDGLCVGAHRLLVEGSDASAGRRFVLRAPGVLHVRPGDTTLEAPVIVEEAFQLEVVSAPAGDVGTAAGPLSRVEVVGDGDQVLAAGYVGGSRTLRTWVPTGRYVVRRIGATSGPDVTVDGTQPDTEVQLEATGAWLAPRPSPRPRPPADPCGAGRCG